MQVGEREGGWPRDEPVDLESPIGELPGEQLLIVERDGVPPFTGATFEIWLALNSRASEWRDISRRCDA
jgi:hypothetical protein